MARLKKLKVENFKKIEAIEFSPQENVTIVGGLNEEGKSSLLDAITVLLQGKMAKIPEPVRRGSKRATIEGDIHADQWDAFGDLHITRSISAKGNWSIKVENKDGAAIKSPETMLKRIFGEAMDPVAFVRMSGKEKLDTLKRLVGLDFTELDAKRKEIYDQRTLKGREVAAVEGALKEMDVYPDAQDKPISVADLMKEWEERKSNNDSMANLESELENIDEKIADLQAKLELLKSERRVCIGELEEMEIQPVEDIEKQIEDSESTNARITANQQYAQKSKELEVLKTQYSDFTEQLNEIDAQKEKSLSGAQFPIEGLSFDESQALYNGLPIDEKQLSSEELLRISFAIAVAANPTLKNILIREGSLLDNNHLKIISDMAEKENIGLWIECVGDDPGKATIVIENGRIKGSAEVEEDFSDI
jgi:recombinational DNA repair ATPase RecF